MKLIFGLQLDEMVAPRRPETEKGVFYCGPQKLLKLFETFFGLSGYPDDIEYLRIEQYRQALLLHQNACGHDQLPFYSRSFEADQFATATEMLSRRDELVLAGWDFLSGRNTPDRLRVLAEIESLFGRRSAEGEEMILSPGYADRFAGILNRLDREHLPLDTILLNEPLELMPSHFIRLFTALKQQGSIALEQCNIKKNSSGPGTDLQEFQARLLNSGNRDTGRSLRKDGSLLLIKAKRAEEAAAYLARMIRLNLSSMKEMHLLIPEKSRTLDIAFIREGLPSLGIESASLARPALQILKLAPTFLWQPIDPFKILEFVSLAVKPLPSELSVRIAQQVAGAPGLMGEGWYSVINRYFTELENKANPKEVTEQRRQYNFWFERQRYHLDKSVPKKEVLEIFDYLREWAFRVFEDGNGKNSSMLVLSQQARRISELLQALPENELGYLELERIVRTVYEPSPVVFQERETGHMPFVTHAGAFTGTVRELLWWNFVEHEPAHFFSRWYGEERDYLTEKGIRLETPDRENARAIWQRTRPVIAADQRLLLVMPDVVNGEEALPHPLLGDLQAAFSNLDEITLDISAQEQDRAIAYEWPVKVKISPEQLGTPQPFVRIRPVENLMRKYETLTSLESLFYYPYQWFFRYRLQLKKSAILSVVPDNTLMGNLAHRLMEKLMRQDIHVFDKQGLEAWVDSEMRELLAREGAVLLMYGREPERIAFITRLKFAAWTLVNYIRENGWNVSEAEMKLSGNFPEADGTDCVKTEVAGVADLVLERGAERAIIDLKWRGASRRADIIRNEEDLQLVLYARLLSEKGKWAHTGYYIIDSGKLLVRNNLAFKNVIPLVPDQDHRAVNQRILQRMEATWQWRLAQLKNGEIEIRCRQTLPDIEDHYADSGQGQLMMEILEMKGEDARWDDYRTLINLLE